MKYLYKSIWGTAFILFLSVSLHAQNALHFDGVDDRVNCGNAQAFQITGNTITLEAWIKPTAFATEVWQNNIIDKEEWSPQNGYMLRCGAGGKLNFNIGSGSAWNELTSSTTVLSLNTWQHVAGTYDGTYMRIYVNGICTDSTPTSVYIGNANNQNLIIGDNSQSGRNFSGTIEEVRIWNVARTEAELQAGMNNELCGGATGLIAQFHFNSGTADSTNTGITTAINTANSSNGTLSGFALNGTTSNWVTGKTLTPAQNYGIVDTLQGTFCSGSSYTFAGQSFNTAGYHSVNLYALGGCDSIVVLDLTQLQSVMYSYKDTFCQGLSYNFNGQTITTPGTYSTTLTSSNGCDSLVYAVLSYRTFNTGLTKSSDGTTLTSKQGGCNYQWLDCDNNNTPIAGANARSFSPSAIGNYCVVMSKGGCSDTSVCMNVSQIIAISNIEIDQLIEVYPNPTRGKITIKTPSLIGNKTLSLTDISGKVVYQQETQKNQNELDLSTLKGGLYILQIKTTNDIFLRKVIVY